MAVSPVSYQGTTSVVPISRFMNWGFSPYRRRTPTMTTAAPAETKQLIRYRVDSGVAIIELNDPPANTYSYEMNRQLDDAILKARMDNDVYVIVLTGIGDKFFSAGANIKMLASVDPTFKYYFCLHANET